MLYSGFNQPNKLLSFPLLEYIVSITKDLSNSKCLMCLNDTQVFELSLKALKIILPGICFIFIKQAMLSPYLLLLAFV